jgi:2',3'-cyclic-nucleotide 2'-phosphodiesterase (5'-nucleotidase family)
MRTIGLLLAATLALGGCEKENDDVRTPSRLTVLFTTDEHSHLYGSSPEVDDFPVPSAPGTGAIVGGMGRVAAVLEAERAAAAARSADTITVSAGDFSQGTLASAAYLALAPELALMRTMKYDAVAIGNHELDLGPGGLAGAIHAALGAGLPPLVLTNAFFDPLDEGDDLLAALHGPGNAIAPSRVIETAAGLRIGVVGVMGLAAGIDAAAAASPLAFWDPAATTPGEQLGSIVATVQEAVTALRAQGVDAVIVLGHGGIGATPADQGGDQLLAASVAGIDLVVSGHSHLSTAEPIWVEDPEGHLVPIVQPKPCGAEVGRVELVLGAGARAALDPARTAFIPVDDGTVPTADPEVGAILASVRGYLEVGPGAPASFLERALSYVEGAEVSDDPDVLGDLYFRTLGHTTFDVVGRGLGETNGMNLDTDAMLAAARAVHTAHPTVAALQARGAIRSDLRAGRTGDITFADVFDVVPLGADPTVAVSTDPAAAAAVMPQIPGYPLVRFDVFTVELRAALEVALLQSVRDPDFFVGPSGLVVDYDMTRAPLFDPAEPLGPGWIERIAVVGEDGAETEVLYDVAQAGWNGSHFVADPFALQPVVATYYVASFAQLAGITPKDDGGVALSAVAAGILRRGDGSAVKDHEALAKYVRDECLANGGELPDRYGGSVPRRMRPAAPAVLPVRATSGAVDLEGSTAAAP